MRVALCLSGEPRKNIRITLESINKYIISPTNCDVFMSISEDDYVDELFQTIKDNNIDYKLNEIRTDTFLVRDCVFVNHLKKVDKKQNFPRVHHQKCL